MSAPAGAEPRVLAGAGVGLLIISLGNGFVIKALPLPRLAQSAHLVGLIGAVFLIALGALWPSLQCSGRLSRIGVALALYGFLGAWLMYFAAAATGTGGMFPMASRGIRGTPAAENLMSLAMLTVAIALFALCGVVPSGLRGRKTTRG